MNNTIAIIAAVFVSFGLGTAIWLYILRGFIGKYWKAKATGGVLMLNFSKGGDMAHFFVARPNKKFAGAYTFKGEDGRDKIIVPRGIIRLLRVRFAMVLENDTSPLLPAKVHRVNIEYDKPTKKNLDIMAFTHEDDSVTIGNLLMRALTRPKKRMAEFSMKVLLPILIAVGAVIFLIMQMGGGGI